MIDHWVCIVECVRAENHARYKEKVYLSITVDFGISTVCKDETVGSAEAIRVTHMYVLHLSST
jgi:hypothetical protein